MVSSQKETTSPTNHCKWKNCPSSSQSLETPEQLLDHVLERHIPTTIKNEDDEEEVICEWEGCQMGTTRGDIEKKTEWMRFHFKTRHVKSAKTCKCLFEGCEVVKATNRELENHVRMIHFAKPKKVNKKAPAPVVEKKPTNRIWKIVKGCVVWQKPPKVTEKTIVYYEDGPRYVYPRGHERDSESDWELSEEDVYERGPVLPAVPGLYPRPHGQGPFIRVDKSLRKKKCAEKIEKERKEAEKVKEVESEKREKEESTRPASNQPKVAPTPRRDVNDNIIWPDPSDDFDAMPALKAYYEDSDPDTEVAKPHAAKTEKKVTLNDTPQYAPSPVKHAQVKKVKKVVSKPKILAPTSKPSKTFEVAKKPTTPPVKTKKVVEEHQKSSPASHPPIAKTTSTPFKPKMKPAPTNPSKKRKLILGKRPSRACRALGSLEEVPFEIEIEVEFEKPKKLIKKC